jgi:hypothetical protein
MKGYGSETGNYTLAYRAISGGSDDGSNGNNSYDYSLSPNTNWLTHSGNTSSRGYIIYRVAVSSGIQYMFKTGCGNGATANFDTYLELYTSLNNDRIAYNDDACESYRSSLAWTATFDGYVYLKVKGYGQESGSYTLAYIISSSLRSSTLSEDSEDSSNDKTITAVDNITTEQIIVSPNPTTGLIYIRNGDEREKFIYAISGALLICTYENEINLSNYPKGIYILRIENSEVVKIVKK